MKKKALFYSGIALGLILIVGGILWLKDRNENSGNPISKNTFAKAESYEIIDTPDGKFVENNKEGFKISVPSGWVVRKYEEELDLLSPEVDENNILESVRRGACGLSIEIYESEKVNSEITTFAEDLRAEMDFVEENAEEYRENEHPRIEVITVDNKKAIKRTYMNNGQIGIIEVAIPAGETVYSLSSGLIGAQKCVEQFDELLATVLIDK